MDCYEYQIKEREKKLHNALLHFSNKLILQIFINMYDSGILSFFDSMRRNVQYVWYISSVP